MYKAFNKYGIEYPTFDYYCSLRIARYIVKGCYSYSLDVVANHLGLEFGVHHKADSDSLGCALILLKCLELDGSKLNELEEKYSFHKGSFAPNTFIAQLQNKKHYYYPNNHYNYRNIINHLEDHPELVDKGNYYYGKTVCFTGTTKYAVRKDMLQMVKNVGGIPIDSVTKNTDILVVGQQDYRIVGSDGMSSKQKKALSLLEKGNEIEILSETEFISRL